MAVKAFYSSQTYREKQSARTKLNWQNGVHDFLRKQDRHKCNRKECKNTFYTRPSNPKKYCSQRCSAMVSNVGRVLSTLTRLKIAKSATGKKFPNRPKKPLEYRICLNPDCQRSFPIKHWRPVTRPIKYCSVKCAMLVIGGRPTSPRAARAKAGIRPDIDPEIYFYSRWEANYARILNLRKIKWVHQPKRFKLISQHYTPDFYLPRTKTYIEIKNFLAPYSLKRDTEFRQLYPKEKLILILKDDYKRLESKYSPLIKNWEFSNR